MKRNSILWRMVTAGVLCAACRSEEDAQRWRGSLTGDAGIVEVRNPAQPVFSGAAVRAQALWTAPQLVDEQAVAGWDQPTRLALGPNEVYVLDPMARTVHVLSRSGRSLRHVGREGDGPGELRRPFGLAFVNGVLAVGDAGGTVDLFSPAGEASGALRLGTVATSLVGVEPGALLVKNFRGEQRLYPLEGGKPEAPLAGFGRRNARTEFACSRVAGAGTEIVRLDCATPVFQVLGRDGAVVRTVRVDREPLAATHGELEFYRRALMAEIAQAGYPGEDPGSMVEGMLSDQNPKRLMRGIRYDTASALYTVWEQQPQELGNGPARLHLFSREGVFLATADFGEPWVDFAMDDLRVYALVENPTSGEVRLTAYQVTLDPAVMQLARTPLRDRS